jgi:hypothetical protein
MRVRGHESTTHLLTAEERRAINDRQAAYFQQYGYTMQPG